MFVSACRRYVAVRSPLGHQRYIWWIVTDDLAEMRVEATEVPREIRRMAYRKMTIRD
jgi:hypothetical protein